MSDDDDVRNLFHEMRANLIRNQMRRLVSAAGGDLDEMTNNALREIVRETSPATIDRLVALLERLADPTQASTGDDASGATGLLPIRYAVTYRLTTESPDALHVMSVEVQNGSMFRGIPGIVAAHNSVEPASVIVVSAVLIF